VATVPADQGPPYPKTLEFTAPISPGDYEVSWEVRDDEGAWSAPVTDTLLVQGEMPECCLDPDDSGAADALTDGLLIVRYLFGFRGPALVEGVLAPGAGRTDPDAIAAFLDTGLSTMLDPDDSGAADALTDGLLIVRYLFGFRGPALVEGVLAPGAGRADPDAIAAFLDAFLPE
jgi:hypothetical protein